MSLGLFKNVMYKVCLEIIYLIYMNKRDLALNDQQYLICYGDNMVGIYEELDVAVLDQIKIVGVSLWCSG